MSAVFKFRNDLIEAYKGYYEDQWDYDSPRFAYNEYVQSEEKQAMITKGKNRGQLAYAVVVEAWESWFLRWIEHKIVTDDPKTRLQIYLEWNGILGYTDSIYDIAMGKFSAN